MFWFLAFFDVPAKYVTKKWSKKKEVKGASADSFSLEERMQREAQKERGFFFFLKEAKKGRQKKS